jgi:hypothetical protein
MKIDDIPVASLEIPVSLHIEGTVPTLSIVLRSPMQKAEHIDFSDNTFS